MRARFSWMWVPFLLLAPFIFPQGNSTQPVLRVEEQKIRFLSKPGQRLELPLVSSAHQAFDAHISLELLKQDDSVRESTSWDGAILPGSHTLVVPWTLKSSSDFVSDLYWWRLRYRITPKTNSPFQEGIVPLSRIIPDLFRIQVSSLRHPQPGASFPVRVRIVDPSSGKGVSGVQVQVHLDLGEEDHKQPATTQKSKTDAHGIAVLIFKLPRDVEDEPSLVITAQRGSWIDSKTIELELRDRPAVTVSTDKPIYQPGQVMHMRALVFGPDNQALANAAVRFTGSDEDSNDEFELEVKTSAFGIAQAEWKIPDKVRLGDYGIHVAVDDTPGLGFAKVRISRYELPQFTVNPATDKTFYLPGEQPLVEVKADYLFGQPVKRGSVRIVRDNGKTWNPAKKEYDDDQAEIEHGQLDSAGKFTATLDLNHDFQELRDSDYRRYQDVRFAAYVTDLSTNRTEQKHFTVRLSKDPIHIYVMGRDQGPLNCEAAAGTPIDCFVTTALPDGTAASVDVTVSVVKPDEDGEFPDDLSDAERMEIAHLHTNKYGVGHLHTRPVPSQFLHGPDRRRIQLVFEAGNQQAGITRHTEQLWLSDRPYLQITPANSLWREGESVIADVESTLPDQEVFVDLLGDEGVLTWQRLQLKHGHARAEFAYDEKFHNKLTLVAHALHAEDDGQIPVASVEVLFPEPQELNLDVHFPRTTYKPGELAFAKFNVRAPDGKPAKTALGVVIYDKAVAERVRTDQEFGHYGFFFEENGWNPHLSIAGVTYRDLLNRKLTGPVSPDLELLAQVILATGRNDFEVFLEGDDLRNPAEVFHGLLHASLFTVESALNFSTWIAGDQYPQTLEQLREVLALRGIDFDSLRDPWGMPYRARFYTEGAESFVEIMSTGPDKLPDTKDDFVASTSRWRYFSPIGHAIDEVAVNYARETGNYIRDYEALAKELKSRRGIDLQALNDPWGHPYQFTFDVEGPSYRIHIISAGPDGVFDSQRRRSSDDVQEWTSRVHYFQRETDALDSALAEHFRKTAKFPTNDEELRPVLEAATLSGQSLLDPWGNPYHFTFSQISRYSDQINISRYSVYGGEDQRVTNITPVTQKLGFINVVSYGPHNNPIEQFPVAAFSRVVAEQSSKDLAARQNSAAQPPSTGGTGAISGSVVDPQGAVIPGAKITATDSYTGRQYSTTSGPDGSYLLRNLPAGSYRIDVSAQGFQTSVVTAIPVTSSNLTKVDVRLNVGATSEVIEVTAAAPLVNTDATSVSSVVKGPGVRVQAEQQVFTPRLRKYFPETLLWQPELVTDSAGKAQLKFAMADNITTWKMSVIGSTISGRLGVVEKELRTFQPFFIDHEPPKILTQGDQIQLPSVLRNYLNKSQPVDVKLEQSSWFSLLGAPQQRIEIPAGQDAVAQFSIVADHTVREGKERVTASNRDTGDAVEHTVAVHPDGEDVSQTVAALLSGGQNSFNLEIPANAIPGSMDAELRIYPNLGAHLLDSLNALAVRPAGCGEQITSTAFASVVVLQFLHKAGQDDPEASGNPNAELAKRARKYVTEAYQQLFDLQAANGGFPYWHNYDPDVALTAHVLDFLAQASPFINVDEWVVKRAEHFLASTQQPEGNWLRRWYSAQPKPDVNLTALITRVLAETNAKIPNDAKAEAQQSLGKAMKFLEDRIAEWSDAYVVGQYALAASMAARADYVGKAQAMLRRLAHEEGPGTYWNLEANTSPFYGWGMGGRLETTGLAVRALAHLPRDAKDHDSSRLLDRGLIYLLRSKDRYGIWYSTQATINVLRGIVDALPAVPQPTNSAATAELRINGKLAATIQLPASTAVSGPITANISALLEPGVNKIEVVRQNDSTPLQVQIFSTHYIPWAASQATKNNGLKMGDSRALRLKVGFDHLETHAGSSVQCKVEAERIGFEGYGMMLAEIGLPPGAEVDRASLQQAVTSSDVSEYDVLPDRVVLYLWPQAGGSKLNFTFKPRFGMNAAAAPSILYDYYNPDARATLAPERFIVH